MEERKWELDVIRIIACLFVIVIHVAGYGMEVMNPGTSDWMIRNLITCMTKCAVPVFFMLSGILFLEKDITIRTLYKKYISRIIVIWCVWSAFYAAIDYVAYLKGGNNGFRYFLFRFLTGHYHLWFLPSLLVAYIFLPILQRLVVSCSDIYMKYLGAVTLVGVILKETLDPFLQSPEWDGVWNNMAVPGASVGIVYFVLGYYLYKHVHWISEKKSLGLYICSSVIVAGINTLCARISGEHSAIASGYMSLGIFLSAVGFFSFGIQFLARYRIKTTWEFKLRQISDYTLGIYLIHTFFIEQVFRRVGLYQANFATLPAIVVFFALTLFCSCFSVWCMKRIPVLGKWIV